MSYREGVWNFPGIFPRRARFRRSTSWRAAMRERERERVCPCWMRVDYERFRVSWDSISEGNLRIVILEKNEAILSFLFENFFQQAIVSFNFIIILKEVLRCLVISNNFCVFTGIRNVKMVKILYLCKLSQVCSVLNGTN